LTRINDNFHFSKKQALLTMNIIVAPLNWGLGHATRMVPIIQALLEQNINVHLASDGEALAVLKNSFPTLPATELPSYNIKYKHNSLLHNSFSIGANMLRAIPKEKKAIHLLAKAIKADIIISDNRYGCHTDFTQNIFVTHQLNILTGNLTAKSVNIINQRLLKPFDTIWVPDYPNTPNLAGKLSHNSSFNKIQYIGALSRFQPMVPTEKTIDVLTILSGPEPQRSYFEKIIRQQFADTQLKIVIVRGKPLAQTDTRPNTINFAFTSELSQLIASSKLIISRSGYSSIMDYAALGLFASTDTQIIFVPTPGQPEQIYLAEKFRNEGLAYSIPQEALHWESIQKELKKMNWTTTQFAQQQLLHQVLDLMV